MKGMYNVIAEKIYKAMEQQGMTTYKLAQLIGMKYELLRRVFRGERKLTADELLLIMKYVDVDLKAD